MFLGGFQSYLLLAVFAVIVINFIAEWLLKKGVATVRQFRIVEVLLYIVCGVFFLYLLLVKDMPENPPPLSIVCFVLMALFIGGGVVFLIACVFFRD